MKKMDRIKSLITGCIAVFFSFFGVLAIPLALLIGANVIDWITGLLASYQKGIKITSKESFKGISKKISMYILVIVGFMLDMLIDYVSTGMDIVLPFVGFVACIIAVWLVLNELISITENCEEIGVKVPFLSPIIKLIKGKVEDKVNMENQE